MSQDKSKNDDPQKDKSAADSARAGEEQTPEIDEGPRPGPVDEIQAALFEAAKAGLNPEVDFEELADPVPEIDEGPRPAPVDEVQEALFDAAKQGLTTDLELDSLPGPALDLADTPQKQVPETEAMPETEAAPEEPPEAKETVPEPEPEAAPPPEPEPAPPPEPDPQPTLADVWLIGALFVIFRGLTLLLLRPGGFIRDWSDFDTYFGIAALSDYGLYPFVNFWLEWPPLVPWLSVGAYRLSLLMPPWPDDSRLWFILILGSVFVLFEVGNFILIYRLARRLFQERATVNRVLWMYAGLFAPIYTMLGFFDGVALFFILLALDLLINDQRFPSAIAAGVGIMVKLVPGLVLPIAARQLWYRYRANNRDAGIEIGLYGVALGLTVVILLLPFLIVGPQWVMASLRSMLGRASWETIWAILEGYYGFGVVLGDRLNPTETDFAVHRGMPGWLWGLITLAFAGLYAYLFSRPANYKRPRNVVAFAGLTVAIFMLYSKGYSPQFLLYLLPFILLLMPTGRGLTYALILTGLNVLEQPVYFVLLPNATWLLGVVVITRVIIIVTVAVEFGLILWPVAAERVTALAAARQYAPPVLGGATLLSLLVMTPLMVRAYSAGQLAGSPVDALAGFMKAQVQNGQTESTNPRLLLSEQQTYRQLYPYLHELYDLQLTDGPAQNFTGAATIPELLEGYNRVWVLPTGPQQAALTEAMAAQGALLAAYNFDSLGTVSLYSLRPNPIPTIPLGRFIGGIELLGYQTEFESDQITVTLYWRARNPQNQTLTVFTQLLNQERELVAGHDSIPANGSAPVTTWVVDTVVADSHRISLPPDLPPGQYTLITGLYNDFQERVQGTDADGQSYPNRAVPLELIRLQ